MRRFVQDLLILLTALVVASLLVLLTYLESAAARGEAPEPTERPIVEPVLVIDEPSEAPTTEPTPSPTPEPTPAPAPSQPQTAAYCEAVPLSAELQAVLREACEEFDVSCPLMVALIEHETRFQNITGDGGRSAGYCQIQERWWRGLMDEIGADDLMVPKDNFRTGCAIISKLTARYDNVSDALSAYNTGSPGHRRYANAVLSAAEEWEAVLIG